MTAYNNKYVLADSGYWIAVFEPSDTHITEATILQDDLEDANILLPWPVMYEVLNTRFFRRPDRIEKFEELLKKPNVYRIPEEQYRDQALKKVFEYSKRKRNISLVDGIIREMLSDVNLRINYFVTFNVWDFLDIIKKRPIELLPD